MLDIDGFVTSQSFIAQIAVLVSAFLAAIFNSVFGTFLGA